MKQYITFLMAVLIVGALQAQTYKDMMEDPSYNVYEVIKAGNAYFKNRDKGKGSGYKQFQRWIIENEDLFYPSGDRTNYQPELPYLLASVKNKIHTKSNMSSKMSSNNWTEVGPFVELKRYYDQVRNGNGRVDAIWVDPTNADRIYIGCRGGGLWITTNGGVSWSPKTDGLGITGVNSIVVNPSNVNEIYIATAIAGARSLGVFKSTNGGDSWAPTGLSYVITSNVTINKIMMDPGNTAILFAATSIGLLKSSDGFQTYTTVLSGNIIDIEFKPGDTSVIYASNNGNNTIYRSTNSGVSFSSTGLITSNKPQIGVSANQPNYVFISDNGELHRSTDSGVTFSSLGVPDGGTGQYGGFAVSDTNANLLMNGSLDTYRSTNGGLSFSKVTNWIYNASTGIGGNFVHADIREIEVVNGVIYLGTDGWLCKSVDGGTNYEILTFNVGNHEIYEHGLGVSQTSDNTIVIGTQDNGTSILREGVWRHWKGGDGGTSMIDHSNKDVVYGSLYNGDFKRTDNGATTAGNIDLGDTKPGTLPPLVQHPTDANTLFLGEGSGQVWKSTNKGGSWTVIANLGVGVIDELAVAPSNPDIMYTSYQNRIWKTVNGGTNWTEITGVLPNLVIKGIAIDYNDPNKVVICYTSYTNGVKAYSTANGGTSWSNITGTLPNLPMHDVVYDNNDDHTLYIATDTGVYYKDDNMSDWVEYGNGMPNVRVNDLEIQHASKILYAATWGRGVWKIQLDSYVAQVPDADFSSDVATINTSDSVNFSDASSHNPTSWLWSFPGGNPTSSNVQNPVVTYENAGTYDVSLTVTNAEGTDSKTIDDFITVLSNNHNLLAHYKFDSDILDSSGFSRHLTATGYPASINYENDYDSNALSAISANGDGSYLAYSNNFPITGNEERTVTAWIKTNVNTYQGIVSMGSGGTRAKYSVIINNSGQLRAEVSGTGHAGTNDIADGTWQHIASVYDGAGNNALYVNGTVAGNSSSFGTLVTTNSPLYVATENFDILNRGFQGALDDVQIYGKALSQSEIVQIMNNGALNLKHKESSAFSLYPNPASNVLYVSTGLPKDTEISIYDTLGHLVYKKTSRATKTWGIEISWLHPGMYFIHLSHNNSASVLKFIKKDSI